MGLAGEGAKKAASRTSPALAPAGAAHCGYAAERRVKTRIGGGERDKSRNRACKDNREAALVTHPRTPALSLMIARQVRVETVIEIGVEREIVAEHGRVDFGEFRGALLVLPVSDAGQSDHEGEQRPSQPRRAKRRAFPACRPPDAANRRTPRRRAQARTPAPRRRPFPASCARAPPAEPPPACRARRRAAIDAFRRARGVPSARTRVSL